MASADGRMIPGKAASMHFVSTGRPSTAQVVYRVAMAIAMIAIGVVFIDKLNGPIWPDAFFDARVFGRAVAAIRGGFGPYELVLGDNPPLLELPMVQPPHVAMLLELLARTSLPVRALDVLVSMLVAAGIAVAVVAQARMFIDRSRSGTVLGAGLFAALICGSGMISLVTGNVSGLFFGMLMATLPRAMATGRWGWFHVAVICAALFKPFFISFWILPVLLDGWSWRQAGVASVLAAAVAVVYAAGCLLRQDLAAGWFHVMASRHEVGDVGGGLYALLYKVEHIGSLGALGVHLLFIGMLAALVMTSAASGTARLAALVIVAITANPRMNAYDYAYAAIPAFHVLALRIRGISARYAEQAAIAVSLLIAVVTMKFFLSDHRLNNLALVLIAGCAVLLATHFEPLLRQIQREPRSA